MRSLGLNLLVLTMFVACASNKERTKEQKQADLYFGSGTQSLVAQQYTDAVKALRNANQLDPNNSEILNNLGMAYYFKDEKELALQSLNQSLKINPKNSDTKINLATIHYRDGNIAQAEAIYKSVLKDLTYDKQARTYYNLGLIELENKKNPVAADAYFQKSIKEDENYCPAKLQIGLIKFNQRKYRQALGDFKESIRGLCYENPIAHYYEALSMINLREYDDARLKLSEIQSTFKKSPFANKARSKMLEINELESQTQSQDIHASRKVLESPEF